MLAVAGKSTCSGWYTWKASVDVGRRSIIVFSVKLFWKMAFARGRQQNSMVNIVLGTHINCTLLGAVDVEPNKLIFL